MDCVLGHRVSLCFPSEALAIRRRGGEGPEGLLGSGVGNAGRKIRAELSVGRPQSQGSSLKFRRSYDTDITLGTSHYVRLEFGSEGGILHE